VLLNKTIQKAVSGGKICGLTPDSAYDIEILYLKSSKRRTAFFDGRYSIQQERVR